MKAHFGLEYDLWIWCPASNILHFQDFISSLHENGKVYFYKKKRIEGACREENLIGLIIISLFHFNMFFSSKCVAFTMNESLKKRASFVRAPNLKNKLQIVIPRGYISVEKM